ncbi:16S rRNA (guanine(527)-N(7))-methyltransferase RsmG [Actinoplanes sp. NPDC049599]|uniref:16S rRNA (guanine(527)-N(7))-methyltransferase RsmG n=1 Tax=Actinoplanes sp. NPDC049599 TaxID=3363903 RepID=UPI0037B4DFD5
MTDPRSGAGDNGPGAVVPGPSSSSAASPPAPSSSSAGSPRRSSPAAASPSGSAADVPPAFAEAAEQAFGARLPVATHYAELLITEGVVRGLIGPREAPRIWERHLINCAVMSEMIPLGASVVDVGSGAGLPGIVLAVARPDLTITLVEPLARRTAFLSEAVAVLGLDTTVTVVRGRAEDLAGGPPAAADVVTARAVAPLDRLAGWCLPLAAVGGRLLALKGASAADEVAEHHEAITRLGGGDPVVQLCGAGLIDPPTTVVEIVRERAVVTPRPRPSGRAADPGRPAGNGGRGSGKRRSRRG